MIRHRSILALILAFVAVVLVSCSSPTAAKPPTYTSTQLEQLETYRSDLAVMRDRFPELATLITQQQWTSAKNFIHGPLGELRRKMSLVSRNLLPDAQKQANELSQDIFNHLVKIDQAADETDYTTAIRNYNEVVQDIEAFFNLIPSA
jgi:photosystem II protein PsbQ